MKKFYFLGSVVFLFVFFSCDKYNNDFPLTFDTQIVNNWEFVKFCDNQNNEIYLRDFDADTVPYFSMNLNVFNYDYSIAPNADINTNRWYLEFEGKGPLNFYEGRFYVNADSIRYEDYDVSHFNRINEQVFTYERVYINALASASNFNVRNDSLFIDFDDATKKMVFVQKPASYDTSSIYMQARVANNISMWFLDKKSVQAKIRDARFDQGDGKGMIYQYFLDIDGRYGNNKYYESIEIGVLMNPVIKGKYFFNDNMTHYLGEANGTYNIFDGNNSEYSQYFCKSGEIEITDITYFYIKGKFKMVMTDKRGNDPLFEITDGEFILPVNDFEGFTSYDHLSYYDNLNPN